MGAARTRLGLLLRSTLAAAVVPPSCAALVGGHLDLITVFSDLSGPSAANVGTQAALLGGFSFGLITKLDEDTDQALEGAFLGMAAFSFGMFMYAIICSTLVMSLGPTKAFKGRESSAMRKAIEDMKVDRKKINVAFMLGVVAFQALVCLQIW